MKKSALKFVRPFSVAGVIALLILFLSNMPTAADSVPEPDPFAFKSSSNMEFHEISWQYFRWLTEEVKGGKLRFETLYSEGDVYNYPQVNKGGDLTLTQPIKDSRNDVLGGIRQASSDGILVDHNGRAVYTSIHVNDVYFDFVVKNKLYDPKTLINFPDTTDFPIGAFSLKAAWRVVSPRDNTDGFYTTDAKIQKLVNKNGNIVLSDETLDAEIALVGFHIAVVVNGHPEMIWATFEHNDNAPYVAQIGLPNVSFQLPNKKVSESNYTFYTAGTQAIDCNDKAEVELTLDEATQTLSPITNVFRQYRLGGGQSFNQNNIDDLNVIEHSSMPMNSIWRNYSEVGAIWFVQKDALVPNSSFEFTDPLLTGSILLSNSVIETFTQNDRSLNQCFGCHNTMPLVAVPKDTDIVPGKNVLTSHVLVKNYLMRTGKTATDKNAPKKK